MSTPRSLFLLLGLAPLACGGDTAPGGPATLELVVPPPAEAVAECSSAVVRLFFDGSEFSCPIATFNPNDGGSQTTVIVCTESKGLKSGETHTVEAVYLVGGTVVARAKVQPAPTVLAEGRNKLTVTSASLDRSIDGNGNGTPDIQEVCP